MISIHIHNTNKCSNAANWCIDHLDIGKWALQSPWPTEGMIFKFEDPATATMFGLKWAGNT